MVQQGSGRVLHDFEHAISAAIVSGLGTTGVAWNCRWP